MGQKVHPLIQRIGFIKRWHSLWFTRFSNYAQFIGEDYRIRKFIKEKFKQAAISEIIIERLAERVKIKIRTARPGLVIGRHGADIERLREDLNALLKREISIDILEIKAPAAEAQLVAENIAFQLEKRVAFRRAIKRAIEQAINAGVEGIKISCAGRLGGVEMSRRETYKQGKIPLQTLRADIDYGFSAAFTTYGVIGIKVWIYKGQILLEKTKSGLGREEAKAQEKMKIKE
jgi:small subunit ribosomal protein S3